MKKTTNFDGLEDGQLTVVRRGQRFQGHRGDSKQVSNRGSRETALTDADRRGLTPLFWTHVAPYGEVKLGMATRLALNAPTPAPPAP